MIKTRCVLLAIISLGAAGTIRDEDPFATEFLPISLKCPAGYNGVFEQTLTNKRGDRVEVRLTYKNEDITSEIPLPGNPHVDPAIVDAFLATLATTPEGGLDVTTPFDKVYKEICLGSKSKRQKYDARLKANRKIVGLPQ